MGLFSRIAGNVKSTLITIMAKIHHLQQNSSNEAIMSINNLIASFLVEISAALLQHQSLVLMP
jgi:hypothetical protein